MSAIGGLGAGSAGILRAEEESTVQELARPGDGSSEQSVNVPDLSRHIELLIKGVIDIEADIKAITVIDEETPPESGPQMERGVTSRQRVLMNLRRELVGFRSQAAVTIKQLFESLLKNGEIDRAIRETGKLSKKLNVNISDQLLTDLSGESIEALKNYLAGENPEEKFKDLTILLYSNFGCNINVTSFFTSIIIPFVMVSADRDFDSLRDQVMKISRHVQKDLNEDRKREIKAQAEAARSQQPMIDDGNGPGAGAGV